MVTKAKSLAGMKEFEKFLTKFEKSFGEGTLQVETDSADKPYEVISTGSLDLDYKTGVGGYVRGRLVEIWGNEGAGKSTLAILAVAEAQKAFPELRVGWIDMEHVADEPWMKLHGVDITRCHIFKPNSAEDVADAMKDMLQSGLFSLVVLDSIGAMIPEAEKEKDADQAVMMAQAKIVTRMVKIAAVEADRSGTVVLMINQVRANTGYGADTTTGGGFALKHCSTMKFKLSRTGTPPLKAKFGNEEIVVGHEVKIRIERNKVSPAYRDATVVLYHKDSKYGPVGIDKVDEAVTMGLSTGVIEQGGAWYTMPTGERLQGRDAVVETVRLDPSQVQLIRDRIMSLNDAEIISHDIEADIEAADESE